MDELTEQMEQLMKDAARNGDIDKETLQKMAESLKSMQELAEEGRAQGGGETRRGARAVEHRRKNPSRTSRKAVEEQKQVVEKMQEAIEKANDANRRFEAGTFVNRLKKAAGEQNGIVSSLKEAFERLLGLKPGNSIPPTRRLSDNSRQQSDTASDVRWIQEDLAITYARTQTSLQGDHRQMRESQIDIGLEDVRSALAKNHSYEAAEQAALWADKLNEWATKLEGEKDESGGGGGRWRWRTGFRGRGFRVHAARHENDPKGTGPPRRTRALEQLRRDHPVSE
jgi:hypothetical protein